MKSYSEYLKENINDKIYEFVIKIAGEIPEHCIPAMETALQKYQVVKFAKIATTPIQAKLKDFPRIANAEVTIFSVHLAYPITSAVLANFIADNTHINTANIIVRNHREEYEAELNIANDKCPDDKNPAFLLTDYAKESNANFHSDEGVSDFLTISSSSKRTPTYSIQRG